MIDLTTKPQLPRVHVKTSGIRMAGRGLFTRDFIAKNQWICEYGGELQHASSFPDGFPQSAKSNTHTRGVEPMFSRLQAKNLTPQNADGKLASFANDTRDSKTNNAAFQAKHVTTKRARKQVWLKATKPINPARRSLSPTAGTTGGGRTRTTSELRCSHAHKMSAYVKNEGPVRLRQPPMHRKGRLHRAEVQVQIGQRTQVLASHP